MVDSIEGSQSLVIGGGGPNRGTLEYGRAQDIFARGYLAIYYALLLIYSRSVIAGTPSEASLPCSEYEKILHFFGKRLTLE